MTCNNNTVVGVLVSSTRSTRTSTNRRKVVGYVYTEAMQVVQYQAVHEASATEVSIQDTRILVLQHFDEDWVKNDPATTSVNVLDVEQTAHTCNDLQWGSCNRRNRSCTGQTRSNRDRMIISTRSSDVREVTLVQLVSCQQFVRTSRRVSFSARNNVINSVSNFVFSWRTCSCRSQLVAGEVAKNFLVHLVCEAVCRTISCQVHEVDVAVCFFDVIQFECEVVSFIDNKLEVGVYQVLSSNSRATSVLVDSYFRLFHDANSVALICDFTKVVVVGDCVYNSRLAECKLYLLRIDYWREVAVWQVAVTRYGSESHS